MTTVRKHSKLSSSETSRRYIDTRFIFPTSNIFERFLSKAGSALDDRRGRLFHQNVEAKMFLHYKTTLRNVLDIDSSYTNAWKPPIKENIFLSLWCDG